METKDLKDVEEIKDEEVKKDKKDKKEHKKNKHEEEILDLKNQVSLLEDKLLRSNAEMINFRKRKDEETSRLLEYANEDLVKDLLIIVDNFEHAIDMDDDNLDDEVSKFLSGFKMTYCNFLDILKKYDVCVIDPINEEFDPNYHNAVMTEQNESVDNNIITEVLQKGYMLKNKVIRPAMVKVNQNIKKEEIEKKGDNNE